MGLVTADNLAEVLMIQQASKGCVGIAMARRARADGSVMAHPRASPEPPRPTGIEETTRGRSERLGAHPDGDRPRVSQSIRTPAMIVQFVDENTGTPIYINPEYVMSLRPDPVKIESGSIITLRNRGDRPGGGDSRGGRGQARADTRNRPTVRSPGRARRPAGEIQPASGDAR